jgi:hypothetical protein
MLFQNFVSLFQVRIITVTLTTKPETRYIQNNTCDSLSLLCVAWLCIVPVKWGIYFICQTYKHSQITVLQSNCDHHHATRKFKKYLILSCQLDVLQKVVKFKELWFKCLCFSVFEYG